MSREVCIFSKEDLRHFVRGFRQTHGLKLSSEQHTNCHDFFRTTLPSRFLFQRYIPLSYLGTGSAGVVMKANLKHDTSEEDPCVLKFRSGTKDDVIREFYVSAELRMRKAGLMRNYIVRVRRVISYPLYSHVYFVTEMDPIHTTLADVFFSYNVDREVRERGFAGDTDVWVNSFPSRYHREKRTALAFLMEERKDLITKANNTAAAIWHLITLFRGASATHNDFHDGNIGIVYESDRARAVVIDLEFVNTQCNYWLLDATQFVRAIRLKWYATCDYARLVAIGILKRMSADEMVWSAWPATSKRGRRRAHAFLSEIRDLVNRKKYLDAMERCLVCYDALYKYGRLSDDEIVSEEDADAVCEESDYVYQPLV